MNRRFASAVLLFALLAVSAGCAGPLGPGGNLDERIAESAEYDWDTDANATFNVTSDEYTAVYEIENRSTLEVYHYDSFGDEAPLPISAVQFQYPNGTVVGHERIGVEETRHQTVITLPASEGKLAYTAPAGGKNFMVPTFIDGSYDMVLPEGMRVGVFLLSDVRPGADETTLIDDRTHLQWEDVTAENINVRFYLERDLYIFTGIVALLSGVALVGLVYFWLQIRRLEEHRQDIGLDVDVTDEDGGRRRPPFR